MMHNWLDVWIEPKPKWNIIVCCLLFAFAWQQQHNFFIGMFHCFLLVKMKCDWKPTELLLLLLILNEYSIGKARMGEWIECDLCINESEKDEINGLFNMNSSCFFLTLCNNANNILTPRHRMQQFRMKSQLNCVHASTIPFGVSSCILINATFDHGVVITMAFTCCIQHRKN